jgi:cytoskeletal protein CcmA (bactofilin family)
VNIGKSVIIKGELSGSEDLTIEGQIEGKIELKQNVLTIGPNARIKAQVFAKTVVVQGEVHGNVTAAERVEIRDSGSVDGDLSAPRVAISDGAHFRGSIDMQRGSQQPAAKPDVPKAGETARSAAAPAPAVSVAASSGSTGAPVR